MPKRFLSSSDTTALPGLSTTKDFMPAAIAASTSLTLSLRNRIDSGASYSSTRVSTSSSSDFRKDRREEDGKEKEDLTFNSPEIFS